MKYKWLNKQNNNKLIIFFNGWGMDEGVVKHLNPEDYDVVMFYDYNDLETDFNLNKTYQETNVIAWSMGVMIAGVKKFSFNGQFVVINGTFLPIDEKYGINSRIYDLTIKSFDEKGREKFINNMFNGKVPEFVCSRALVSQRSELIALKNYRANPNFKPSKIYISDNDKIIPTKNQTAFWNMEPNLNGGHCPFFNYKKWSELL